jgi:hypothetical protein
MATPVKFGVKGALITPAAFNSIKDIHDQDNLSPDIVQELGTILKKYNVADKYMLGLLHRHYTLPDNALAITTEVSPDVAVTKITHLETVDVSELQGQLYCLTSDDQWQAYEYEYHGDLDPVSFDPNFLSELGNAIVSKGLQHKVSLASSTNASDTNEFQLGSNATVTIASRVLNLQEDCHPREVAWAFDDLALPGNYQIRNTTGNHTQLYFTVSCTALGDIDPFHFEDTTDLLRELKRKGYLK